MTYAEAAAAIGRRVKITSGIYDGFEARINDVTSKLVVLELDCCIENAMVRLAPYRLELINEEETER